VNELLLMLDTTAWEHAPSLASIYRYVIELLTFANMKKSPVEVQQARFLLGELGTAFAQAASQVTPIPAVAASYAGQAIGSRLSLQA
jgi:flagellin-specific chaperone FliS